MAAYLIVEVKVNDDAWIPDYAAAVHKIAEKHGGKYLSRSANITTIEGDAPDATVIAAIQFPSVEAAKGFIECDEYAPFAASRHSGSTGKAYIIDDSDATGAIPYLPAG